MPTYAIELPPTDNILVNGNPDNVENVGNIVSKDKNYVYGITGGNVYVDSKTTQYSAVEGESYTADGGLKGTVNVANELLSPMGFDALTDINTVLQEKTESANEGTDTVITGNTGLQLENYGKDWVRYYGAVGGDISINTGLQGSLGTTIGGQTINLLLPTSATSIVRNDGNIDNTIESGSVIGGVGGSAALALGNVNIDAEVPLNLGGLNVAVTAGIKLDGKTSTTINGNVNTTVDKDANLVGFMNGGLAAGLGGQATSTVTGNTELTIDGDTGRADYDGDYEEPGNDMIPPITTALNVMKGSKINAIGVAGGGTALTTLGGTAESHVNGTTTINVNNATVLGAIGGGIAGAVDATLIGDKITGNPVGNDDGNSGFGINYEEGQFDIVTGPAEETAPIHVTITNVNEGGTATATTGDTNINLTGKSTTVGAIGGGVAVASHTYTYKEDKTDWVNNENPNTGYSKNDEYGKSVAEATTGKSHITIALDNTGLDGEAKNAMLTAVGSFKDKLVDNTGDLQADELKALANKGAAVGVFGGGVAIAHSGYEQLAGEENKDKPLSETDGAFATATTAGTDIQLASGYIAGVMGGGIAGAMNNSTATAEMSDDVNITIGGYVDEDGNALNAEVVGVFGNGLAYFTGTSDDGNNNLKGKAQAIAENTTINVRGGSVDGIIGGGMAIDDSQSNTTNAIANTNGTATINVTGGTVNKVDAFSALTAIFKTANVTVSEPGLAGYVDGVNAAASNAAIAAGGIALGGGSQSSVENAQVNIVDGDVEGDVYAGGIAAFGMADNSTLRGTNGGSYVTNSTLNLYGGKIEGNVFAGGAIATQTSADSDNAVKESYDNAVATVGTTTINLAGTDVTGVLSGRGTVNQAESGDIIENDIDYAKADKSTLNLIGENTLRLPVEVKGGAEVNTESKIHYFTDVNATAGSVTKVKGLTANAVDGKVLFSDTKLNVTDSAYLDISNINEDGVQDGQTYHIAKNMDDASTYWDEDALTYDRMAGVYATTVVQPDDTDSTKESYDIKFDKITEENAGEAAQSMANALDANEINPLLEDGMLSGWENVSEGAKGYLDAWQHNPNMNTAFGRGMMIGEDSAVTGNTVSVARDVADEVAQHLSFTEDFIQDHDSIYGDDNIWAKYIHNKFETDGMSSSFGGITADNDYNGVIVGYDFNQSGKLQSGVAIHYGHGDGTGSFSRNDYDAWGVSLYGALKDEEAGTNLMADISYTKTSNDITGTIAGKDLTADRDLTAWTIGVRGEKEFVSGRNQIVPYVGLRYMNIDPSSYTSYYNGKKAFEYDADKQDIWMVPLGVSFRNETKTRSGWRITPKLDVAYIWSFGDTDNSVDVNMAGASGVSAPLYYTVMDDGSWLASLGVDASHGAWTFGAGYAYQKGDDTKNNKWYVNAGFAF